jgi:hypothetical protein
LPKPGDEIETWPKDGNTSIEVRDAENNKWDARWCHDHGYAHYATKDGFCVGASGKLTKVGTNKSHI